MTNKQISAIIAVVVSVVVAGFAIWYFEPFKSKTKDISSTTVEKVDKTDNDDDVDATK